MENNPKKSKAFIIAFIFILLLLLAGYYLFINRAKIFDTKGVVTMQKIFAPLLGSSKNKDLSVIGEGGTSSTTGKTITGVITTDQNGNKVIQVEAGENIKKGDVLYIASFNKNNAPIVMKAIASDKSKSLVFGVAGEDMLKGTMGNIIIEGILSGVPTNRTEITAWAPNNPLYLSDKIYGGMTKNPPFAPSFIVPVGSVISIDAINGSIRIGGIITTVNPEILNTSSRNIQDYLGSIFGNGNGNGGNNNDNNGFTLNSITIPGTNGSFNNLPTVTVVASPASIVAGGSSVISWISTKATICNAGTGNGTGTTGSFNTGPLTKSKSFAVTCTGANGSKYTGNTFVIVIVPSVCINKATNPPVCDNLNKCLNKATNPPLCTTIDGACLNKATNPPLCTTIDGACLNNANNPPECTTTDNTCQNGSTNYPLCNNVTTLFPSVKVTAKPALIKAGGTSKITWTSKNTKDKSCTLVGGSEGFTGGATAGSSNTRPLNIDTDITVTCEGTNGSSVVGTVTVMIDNSGGGACILPKIPNEKGQCIDPSECIPNPPMQIIGNKCKDTSKYPTIIVKANPSTIKPGEISTITWTSKNTKDKSCTLVGGSEGVTGGATSGSSNTRPLNVNTDITVTCEGTNGSSVFGTVKVMINNSGGGGDTAKFPIVTVTATPPSVDSGKNSKISWTSTNTTSCTLSGGGLTGKGIENKTGVDTGALTKTTSYTVTCIGPNGQRGGNTSVSINGGDNGNGNGGDATVTVTATPTLINSGDSSKITWTSKNTKDKSCTLVGGGEGLTGGETSGSSNTRPLNVQTVVTVTCLGTNGSSVSGSVTIDINPTTPPNICLDIEQNPLIFTPDEKARLAVLLRKFYLVSSTLRTAEDLTTLNNEIDQNKNFISQIEGLTVQCYDQVDPLLNTNGWVRHGNPWYKEAVNVKGGTFPYTNGSTGYLGGTPEQNDTERLLNIW